MENTDLLSSSNLTKLDISLCNKKITFVNMAIDLIGSLYIGKLSCMVVGTVSQNSDCYLKDQILSLATNAVSCLHFIHFCGNTHKYSNE